MNPIRNSLRARLVLIFLAVALVPVFLVGVAGYLIGRSGLQEKTFHMLGSVREMQAHTIVDFLHDQVKTAEFLAAFDRVPVFIQQQSSPSKDASDKESIRNQGADESAKKEVYRRLDAVLTNFIGHFERDGYKDVLLLTPDGEVVYSVGKLADLKTNVRTGPFKESGLAKVWERALKTGKHAMTDYSLYQPAGEPASFVAVPVKARDNDKAPCGVLALRMGTARIVEIMRLPDLAGKTAETYLVGPDRTMRSQSKFTKESTILKSKLDTNSVKLSLEDKVGHHVDRDYRGMPVLSAYGDARISEEKNLFADFEWAVLAEIDQAEVEEDSTTMAWTFLGIGLLIAAVASVLAWLIANSLSKPVALLAGLAEAVSGGNLAVSVPDIKRSDELGKLGQAFGGMVTSLRDQIHKVLGGVDVLSSAAAEISSTILQLVSSTAETSAAVTQTTATIEQVQQAARLSGEKARGVAETSRDAVKVSEEGKKATDETIRRILLIKGQMESIGETVVRLSEHSQAIEAIVASVQDLADQSNLLAVNASIEAARAGDHGKGFSVVAQEIKSLADQSRQATRQIRNILEDTRRWVSAVVMATEQGSKAVQAGVEQSEQSGGAISRLAEGVVAASQVASAIQITSDQQFIGVGQVSTAMSSIEQSMRQINVGTMQLETSAQRLERLGSDLKQLVQHYQVS